MYPGLPKPPQPPKTYVVKPGDNPATIAAKQGLTPQQLLAANPGVTSLYPGMTLKLPGRQTPALPNIGQAVKNFFTSWQVGTSPSSPGGAYVYGNNPTPKPGYIQQIVPGGGFGSGVDILGITAAGAEKRAQELEQTRARRAAAPNPFQPAPAQRAMVPGVNYGAVVQNALDKHQNIPALAANNLGLSSKELNGAGYFYEQGDAGGKWVYKGATAPPTPAATLPGGYGGGGGGYYYRRGGGGGGGKPKPRGALPIGLVDWRVSTG